MISLAFEDHVASAGNKRLIPAAAADRDTPHCIKKSTHSGLNVLLNYGSVRHGPT